MLDLPSYIAGFTHLIPYDTKQSYFSVLAFNLETRAVFGALIGRGDVYLCSTR
jgi:hypothetical protein